MPTLLEKASHLTLRFYIRWECYTSMSSVGRGVIGVLEVDFVNPSHDKQAFTTANSFSTFDPDYCNLRTFSRRAVLVAGF